MCLGGKLWDFYKLIRRRHIPIAQHHEIEVIYDYILLHFNELLNYNSRRNNWRAIFFFYSHNSNLKFIIRT